MQNGKSINVDLSKCSTHQCKCGSIFFEKRVIVKEVPGLIIGEVENKKIPVEIICCRNCGQVLDDFLPLLQPLKN